MCNQPVKVVSKIPGNSLRLEPVKMDFHYATSFGKASPEAYERLLLDAIAGDATLFARRDEVEETWKFIDHIEHAWHESKTPPPMAGFVAGSWGRRPAPQGRQPVAPAVESGCRVRRTVITVRGWYAICDWGTHLFDTAQWANDTEHSGPVEVEGTGNYWSGGLFNTIKDYDVTFRYENGVVMTCKPGNPSIKLGRKLKWDPAAEQFIGDSEALALMDRARRDPWQLAARNLLLAGGS